MTTRTARQTILERVAAALRDVDAAAEPEAPVPAFRLAGPDDAAARTDTFASRARAYKVRVERAARADAPQAAARLLAERGHLRLAMPADFPVDLMPEGVDLVRDEGLAIPEIAAMEGVLTTCACAIAETGTIVLDHGEGQGRRALTLLPDYHLCFVEAARIVGLVPEAVARMEPSVKAGRPLTFVSGPSATSDIELNRVEGVHGPRTLDVIVVED